LINDIVLMESMVLDGRNRLVCCRLAGVEPRFVEYEGDTSPQGIADYVRDQNANRRHLSSQQLAACAVLLTDWEAKEQEAEERRQSGRRKGGGDRKQQPDEAGDRSPQNVGGTDHSGEANEILANEFCTNRQYIADMKKLDRETVEKIRDGELTL